MLVVCLVRDLSSADVYQKNVVNIGCPALNSRVLYNMFVT